MTEEQIKQNAEAYASKLVERDYHEDIWLDLYDAYIAGAHSRDEEIKELKEEIESLQEQYDSLFDGFSKRGKKLGELMKENVKFRSCRNS